MKNNKLKSSLAALGIVLALVGSTSFSTAQTNGAYLCRWDKNLEWCLVSAPDGYCAFGGDSCTTTIPTVE